MTPADKYTNSKLTVDTNRAIPGNMAIQMVRFAANASGATCWPNF